MTQQRARGRFERFLMAVMGPPQVGENVPPEGYVADATAEVCDRCGRQWSAHQRHHKDNVTYLRCPDAG